MSFGFKVCIVRVHNTVGYFNFLIICLLAYELVLPKLLVLMMLLHLTLPVAYPSCGWIDYKIFRVDLYN
jgi:hypothetical protein